MRLKHLSILFLILVALPAFATHTCTTCYIDYVNGLDTNDGTTKTTGGGHGPWKLAPFMQTVTGNAASQVYAAGDSYIFKGGVVWPNSVMGMQIVFTSASSSTAAVGCAGTGCIYIGVDQTWYDSTACAAKSYPGFCRPVMDTQGAQVATYPGGIGNTMLDTYGGSNGYIIVDNIEWIGPVQLNNTGIPTVIALRCSQHCEYKNNYIHGWSHGGTATQDNAIFFSGGVGCPQDTTSSVHDNVVDGSDTTNDMGMAAKGAPNYFYNNYIAYMRNGMIADSQFVWQNTWLHMNGSFDATSHGNVYEIAGCPVTFWNNRIDDSNGGATLFMGPLGSATYGSSDPDKVFNNLITTQANQPIQVASNVCGGSCTGTGEYIFNNVIQITAGNTLHPINGPGDGGGLFIPFMTIENNHFICDATNCNVNWGRTTTQTEVTDLSRTNAQATSDGYTQSETYWYSPPSGSGITVGAGTNAVSLCNLLSNSAPAMPLDDCKNDTSYGVGYDTTNHKVIVPGRTVVARPASAAWDIGPYQFGSSPSTTSAGMTGNVTVTGSVVVK